MKIIFFEIQKWEKDRLQSSFLEGLLVEAPLSLENVKTDTFKDAEIVSTFINSSITKEVIDQLPNVKFISTRSTGYDHIDIEYCKSKGIKVVNVPEYGSNTVAEHTFALLLSLTRKIYESVNHSKNLNFEHNSIRGVDLYGKTIGIIGLGKIGVNVLRIAQGFGMKALVYNRSQDEKLRTQYGFEYTDLNVLLSKSDVITFHLPLNEQTKHILNKENIVNCKKNSFLINTARGGLVQTEAIVMGLEKGILAGVGLDVIEEEKELGEEISILSSEYRSHQDLKNLIYGHILINHPKVLITPHNAFNSVEALERITSTTIDNIKKFMDNKPLSTLV